jgi:hypothetical protein
VGDYYCQNQDVLPAGLRCSGIGSRLGSEIPDVGEGQEVMTALDPLAEGPSRDLFPAAIHHLALERCSQHVLGEVHII